MLVFDFIVCKVGPDAQIRFFPHSYFVIAQAVPDGLVPLYIIRDEHGQYQAGEQKWRPQIYRVTWDGGFETAGSQHELEWRYGLFEMSRMLREHRELRERDPNGWLRDEGVSDDWPITAAYVRAEATLRENLTTYQQVDLAVTGGTQFRCVGGLTGNLYSIELGNGFKLLHRKSGQPMVSYCYHPEEWLPYPDVALATKLLLEDPEREEEVLKAGRSRVISLGSVDGDLARHVYELERDLLDDREHEIVMPQERRVREQVAA